MRTKDMRGEEKDKKPGCSAEVVSSHVGRLTEEGRNCGGDKGTRRTWYGRRGLGARRAEVVEREGRVEDAEVYSMGMRRSLMEEGSNISGHVAYGSLYSSHGCWEEWAVQFSGPVMLGS